MSIDTTGLPPSRFMRINNDAVKNYYLTQLPPPIIPVMNTWGCIVGTATGRLDGQIGAMAYTLETIYRLAPVQKIDQLHKFWIRHHGLAPYAFPYTMTPDGSCSAEAKEKGFCRPLLNAKDTCAGCGKSWIAGSYNQPSRCKPQQPSVWQKNNAEWIAALITANGGVSRTAPLVTTEYGGVKRLEPHKAR